MNTIFSSSKKRRRLSRLLALPAVAACLWAAPALAAGTPAGTSITNQAYGDYDDANGNPLARVFSNTVTTTVTQVGGVDLSPASGSQSGANSATLYYPVTVQNTGNGSDLLDLTYTVDSGWTPDSVTIYHDVNGDGLFDAGDAVLTDTDADGDPDTGSLAADGSYDILMAVEIPAAGTAPDTSQSVITVTATSDFDNAVTDAGTFTTTVASAVINAVKSSSPASPQPGDTVTYTITLTNSGSTDGTTTLVTDPIPSGVTYVAGSITFNGAARTDASDADNADYNVTDPGKVYVNAGTVSAGGGTATITFQVTVDAAVAAGTSIVNQATVEYNQGATAITTTTNGSAITVASAPGVTLTPGTTTASGDPGDTITYSVTIDNDGNSADTFDLTTSSTGGWTWDLWYDANNDGIAGNDGDFLLTDTDGDGVVDTGSIPAGGTAQILAVGTVPAGTADGATDALVVTARSSVDTGVSSTSGTLTTTVTAPSLQLTKSVDTATAAPGDTVTYTVTATNSGTGTATDVVITDAIPTFTTYAAGTIQTGSSAATLVARTDAADGDGGQYDGGSHTVTATISNLGSGGTYVLRFQVTVD